MTEASLRDARDRERPMDPAKELATERSGDPARASSRREPAPRGRALTWIASGVLVAIWPFLLRRVGDGDVYVVLGPYAFVVLATLVAVAALRSPRELRALFARPARNALVGLAVGVVMTLGTYAAYHFAVLVVPKLAGEVDFLYRASHTTSFGAALAWTAVVVLAEEALWRGTALSFGVPRKPHARDAHAPPAHAIVPAVVSLAAYTFVQIGTGSWVVPLAAFVCGAFWTVERVLTRSVVAPVVSHLVWTMTVIHLWPVTAM